MHVYRIQCYPRLITTMRLQFENVYSIWSSSKMIQSKSINNITSPSIAGDCNTADHIHYVAVAGIGVMQVQVVAYRTQVADQW